MTQGMYRATFQDVLRYYIINLDVDTNLYVPVNCLRAEQLIYNTLLSDSVKVF